MNAQAQKKLLIKKAVRNLLSKEEMTDFAQINLRTKTKTEKRITLHACFTLAKLIN